MCGFAGEFLLSPGRADLQLARAMAAQLAHRGPDEEGSFLSSDGRCAIGFRRLSIIDPPASHQPMSTADGILTVAFNGEIYNYRELRQELLGQGVTFASEGDTEVLLHLYRRLGAGMLDRLEGMFAFALYDASAGRLLLARDRMGEKPLWYAQLADRIVFASQARALLQHPLVPRQISRAAVLSYVTMGYVPGGESIWCGLAKLPPSHYLQSTAEGGTPEPASYWQPAAIAASGTALDLQRQVRNVVRDAVAGRMTSDVPLGALLSGGIDSSVVVSCMCESAGATGGIRTFTAGFEDEEFDERPTALATAAKFGTDHHALAIQQPVITELIDTLATMYDEPFGDSSALATWLICRAARQHVTAALTGDGGDEAFGGYDRYRAMLLASRMHTGAYLMTRLAGTVAKAVAPHDERNRLRRFVRFANALAYPPAVQYFLWRRLFGPRELLSLFTPDFLGEMDLEATAAWFCQTYEAADMPDEVAQAQRHDLSTYLPDDLLVKTDIASMAVSMELRAPFLDRNVVELGLSLPADAKIQGRLGKHSLRQAFADVLPPEILNGPKRGFAVPLGRWLREDLATVLIDQLVYGQLTNAGILQRSAVEGLVNDHVAGRGDHRHRLWALLMLERWLASQPQPVEFV